MMTSYGDCTLKKEKIIKKTGIVQALERQRIMDHL